MPTETLRPDSDVTVGDWVVAPLFSKVNDQSDAVRITAADSPAPGTLGFPVPSTAKANNITGFKLRVRARAEQCVVPCANITAWLTDGAVQLGGEIFSPSTPDTYTWLELDEPAFTFTEAELAGLEIFLEPAANPLPQLDTMAVSQVELVLTYTNTPPTTPGVFTAPLLEETYRDELVVVWGVSTDPDGDPIQYEGEFSSDSGSTWSTLFSLQSGLSYTWDISGLTEGTQYRVRVRAHDGTVYSAAYKESDVFYISTPQCDAGTPDVSGGCTA